MKNPYAWNFSPVNLPEGSGTLVRRAISNDTIGVLKLGEGWLEFWCKGNCVVKTHSFKKLFKAIAKIERTT